MSALTKAAAIFASGTVNLRTSATVTAGTGSTGVSVVDYEGLALVILSVSAIASGTANFVVESSATSGGTYATVATIASVTAAGVYAIALDLDASNAFIRINTGSGDTFGTTTASATFSATKKLR